ncbi:uncharacterized protein isoform X2 [Rhodnius prolixus]|uniref:uncharacterized protein isoform X2 n=1 Tax=Rhodnius prolixus TaxID=13249 RepID=UPI003D18EC54
MKTYSRVSKAQLESNHLPKEFINSCRLCLTNVQDNLFVDIFSFDKKLTKKKIKFCTGLDFSDDDGLPSKICEKCYTCVTNFYLFKNLCISNDLKLQKYSKVPRIIQPELSIQTVEDSSINIPTNLHIDQNIISLVEEKYNTVDFLLEEENVHPDAPNEVMFQIKKDYIGSEMEKYSEILEEIPTGKSMENSTEPPHLPVQQRLLEAQPRYFTCKECSQSFSRTDRLISHEKQAHNIHRLYCSHCSKSFLSKSLIERHMRTHTGSKPFRCTVCSKSFSQKESLNRHFTRLHCEKKYECDKCPKVFTSREGLKSHFFTHHTVQMQILHKVILPLFRSVSPSADAYRCFIHLQDLPERILRWIMPQKTFAYGPSRRPSSFIRNQTDTCYKQFQNYEQC